MSFKEVKQLRIAGQLNEALSMALADFEKNPTDIWNRRSLAWVYYAFLKKAVLQNNLHELVKQVNNIKSLGLPATEAMVFDGIAWQIGKLLFNAKEITHGQLSNVFELVRDFYFTKKTGSYSFLLKAFLKKGTNWAKLSEFVWWWGLDNFTEDDYKAFVPDNGKKTISLVENVYISIARQLLQEPVNTKKVKGFIPFIGKIAQKHKNMQYPPYYLAKLLIAIGNTDDFLKVFLPFARKKQRDFWVWDLISEIYPEGSPEYFSCLCKSLSCGAPNKFTINVKEKLATVLLQKEEFSAAMREYTDIIETRKKEAWPLRDKHHAWQGTSWWKNNKPTKTNQQLYTHNAQFAESLLYANLPEELIVVASVNKNKNIMSFVTTKQKQGFASYKNLKTAPKTAGIYLARFKNKTDSKSNSYQLYTLNETDKQAPPEIYKAVNGKIKILPGNSFGFVNNIFVPPEIVSRHKLTNGSTLNAKALQTYNSKKKQWGFKIIKVMAQ